MRSVVFAVKRMDPADEPFAPAPGEEDGPDHSMRPPAESSGTERLLLVLAVISGALIFLPLTAETALLHWNIIDAGHMFIAPLREIGLWSCLACMAASWLLEKEKEEGGHQAIIFCLLAAILLAAAWAIEILVPFEGWWQALRLSPSVVYCGLAYAFLAKGSGKGRGAPADDEAA